MHTIIIQCEYKTVQYILLLLLPWLHALVRFLITIIWVRPRYYYNNADVIISFNLYLFLDSFLKMYCFVNISYILYFWSNSCLYNNTIYTTYIVLTIINTYPWNTFVLWVKCWKLAFYRILCTYPYVYSNVFNCNMTLYKLCLDYIYMFFMISLKRQWNVR